MKKVLITGATGYIGQFVIGHLLDQNFIVHAVSSKPLNYKTTENILWYQTNLLDLNETKNLIGKVRPTHLLHLAWYVEHGKFWNANENLDWLQASLYLAKQFVEMGGKRMVISGTCAEYDWAKESPFGENKTPLNGQTLYGRSKSALSLTLEKFAEVSDFSFASGKIFFTFGANESLNRLIPSVIRALLENKPVKTSHGNQIRDYLYVEEVAEAFAVLLASDVRGSVNLASGEGVKIKKIVEDIAEIIGKPKLLEIGALSSPENEPSEIVADVTRLREEVGWQKEYNLKKGLIKTVNYWKEKYENHD